MKNAKKFIGMLLLICVIATAGLNSCGTGSAQGEISDTASDTVQSSIDETETTVIADNGTSYFKIVYPENSSESLKTSVTALYNAIKTYSNAITEMEQMADGMEYAKDENAIVIGALNCKESNEALIGLGYGNWTVRFIGKRLVVNAYCDYALDKGITEIIQQFKANHADGKIALAADINIVKTYDQTAEANALPAYSGGTDILVRPEGDNTSLLIAKNTTFDEYESYLKKLKQSGYEQYTTNVIENNYFATYINDGYLVHAGFYAYENSARITVEKKGALAGLKSDNVYTPNPDATTTLAMMGIGTEANEFSSIGMGFIMRLADGSFVVIDGGYNSDAARVYEYMRSFVPDGKITIAAWLITHNDADHRRCFPVFVGTYKDEVMLERLILNFPHPNTYDENGTAIDGSAIAVAKDYGCDIVKAHTGQKFYIRDIEIEILYTLDSYLPNKVSIFNNTSLVFTVKCGTDKILFMGDASDDVAGIINSMYSSKYLRCDFLQLSHHGIRNGYGLKMPCTIELYESVQAEVVLWPSSWGEYLNVNGDPDNLYEAKHEWNKTATDIAREVYIAGGDEFTVFNLPYKSYSAVKFK